MFPRINRLTKKRDIDRVFRKGKRSAAGFVFCNALAGRSTTSRFTVIIGTKSGLKATGRNLFKRRARASIINNIDRIPAGTDMIIGVRGRFEKVPKQAEIAENIEKCLSQLRLS